MWVRVGGGMESIPDRQRHGPADPAFPPPGGPWEPLNLGGRLVGWADQGGLKLARGPAKPHQRHGQEQERKDEQYRNDEKNACEIQKTKPPGAEVVIG